MCLHKGAKQKTSERSEREIAREKKLSNGEKLSYMFLYIFIFHCALFQYFAVIFPVFVLYLRERTNIRRTNEISKKRSESEENRAYKKGA